MAPFSRRREPKTGNPVPRLDLAPKLRRPLQLWNPLDYLRLLYWVFYFPQALRWYVETFAAPGYRDARGRDILTALREDPVQRNLVLQGLLLALLTPPALGAVLQAVGVPLIWASVTRGIAFGVAGGAVLGATLGVAFGVAGGVVFGVTLGMAFGVGASITLVVGSPNVIVLGAALGIAIGIADKVVKEEEAILISGVIMFLMWVFIATPYLRLFSIIDTLLESFLALYKAFGVTGGLVWGLWLLWSLWKSAAVNLVVSPVLISAALGLVTSLAMSVAVIVTRSVAGGVAWDMAKGVDRSAGFVSIGPLMWILFIGFDFISSLIEREVTLDLTLFTVLGLVLSLAAGIAFGVAGGAASGVTLLKPEAWLLGLGPYLWSLRQNFKKGAHLPRITPLPLPPLKKKLEIWLQEDWEKGVHNLNQLLAFSLQFIPVIEALNAALERMPPERLLPAVAELARDPYDWDLVRFGSASLCDEMMVMSLNGGIPIIPVLFPKIRRRLRSRLLVELRFDTSARAACAGFWLLHEGEPEKAAEAFERVRGLPYGEELYRLASALALAHRVISLEDMAMLASSPSFAPYAAGELLRPESWAALERLRRAAQEVVAAEKSVSRVARSLALIRALGELTALLDELDSIPQAERGIFRDIATAWQEALLWEAKEVGEVTITKPVENPYVIGDPVVGRLFVGREDILRWLEELWAGTEQKPSVVLFGHRRMGKTSILRNLPGRFGPQVHVAYVNLLQVGDAPGGVGEVLLAVADAVMEAVSAQSAKAPLPAVDADAFLELPYRTFKGFLRGVRRALGDDALIICLDEFERIEELIRAERIPPDFLGYLRDVIQMDTRIALAFAGLHTLEEMTEDYFHPLYASVTPRKVGFLSKGTTFRLLANPSEDFPLDYDPEALERVWELTSGQPYLVQLIGHRLVTRYNEQVFEQGRPRSHIFTPRDVEATVQDPEFYFVGRYYFTGVWGQAEQGPPGQTEVLVALAPHPEGLSFEQLAARTGLDDRILHDALETLQRHDVVVEEDGRWRYAVELMRRWVLREKA